MAVDLELSCSSGAVSPCTSCGACCSYSAEWPRFSCESDEALARLPDHLVTLSGMRCEGVRCAALSGVVGEATRCTVYENRPDVCRACLPGDDACDMARRSYGMALIRPAQDADNG